MLAIAWANSRSKGAGESNSNSPNTEVTELTESTPIGQKRRLHNAIILVNLQALAVADSRDKRVAAAGLAGARHCIPMIVKDNFETVGLQTTALHAQRGRGGVAIDPDPARSRASTAAPWEAG